MIFRQNWTTLTNNWLVRCSETWISDGIKRAIKRYYRLCWRSLPVCFGLNLSPCCHLSPTTTTIIHHTSCSHHSAHVSTKSWHKCYACYAVSLRLVHFTRSFRKFAEQPQLKFFNSKKWIQFLPMRTCPLEAENTGGNLLLSFQGTVAT